MSCALLLPARRSTTSIVRSKSFDGLTLGHKYRESRLSYSHVNPADTEGSSCGAAVLLRNSRTTDSPAAANSAEFLFSLVPRPAACALLRNSRTTAKSVSTALSRRQTRASASDGGPERPAQANGLPHHVCLPSSSPDGTGQPVSLLLRNSRKDRSRQESRLAGMIAQYHLLSPHSGKAEFRSLTLPAPFRGS